MITALALVGRARDVVPWRDECSDSSSEVLPMVEDDTFVQCFLCGAPALWVIEIAGEDEPQHEEAACAAHARGHWHRALLTSPPEEVASFRARAQRERDASVGQDATNPRTASK